MFWPITGRSPRCVGARPIHERTAPLTGTPPPPRHTGLPSVHLYPSERVKPVTTRLPRLVARGCPAAVLGHLVRSTCLRLVRPVDKPRIGNRIVPDERSPAKRQSALGFTLDVQSPETRHSLGLYY